MIKQQIPNEARGAEERRVRTGDVGIEPVFCKVLNINLMVLVISSRFNPAADTRNLQAW